VGATAALEDDRARGSGACPLSAATNRYKISSVFGSRKQGDGPYFGRQIPALLVYEGREASTLVDAFPHQTQNREYTTIADYLKRL
jgi:hypothetical protein